MAVLTKHEMELTKDELLEAIEQKNEEIKALKTDIKKLEKYKQYDEMADESKAIMDSFVRAGFSEEQAFKIFLTVIANSLKPRPLF